MIVLDTHALIWWVNGSKQLSQKAKNVIQKAVRAEAGVIFVSSISTWEIAMLIEKGRVTLTMELDEWLEEVSRIDGLEFVPVDNETAVASTRLPGEFHKDPADRMIVALARRLNLPLITADEKIQDYKHVKTVW